MIGLRVNVNYSLIVLGEEGVGRWGGGDGTLFSPPNMIRVMNFPPLEFLVAFVS